MHDGTLFGCLNLPRFKVMVEVLECVVADITTGVAQGPKLGQAFHRSGTRVAEVGAQQAKRFL